MIIGRSLTTQIAAHAIGAYHRWTAAKLRLGAGSAANPSEVNPVDPGQGHLTVLPFSWASKTQGTWVYAGDADQLCDGGITNSSDTDADEIVYKQYLAKGTYTLMVLTTKNTDQGILDVYIDAAEVASEDLYAGSGSKNHEMRQAGIVVAASGLKDIKFKVDGKNGSSSGYTARLTYFAFYRTA